MVTEEEENSSGQEGSDSVDESQSELNLESLFQAKDQPATDKVVKRVKGSNKPPVVLKKGRQEKVASSAVSVDVLEASGGNLGVVEESGESCDGRAETEGKQVAVDTPTDTDQIDLVQTLGQFEKTQHCVDLTRLTTLNESLEAARKLAQESKIRYSWSECLLFKHRLDDLGRNVRQLCLPREYRLKCMSLTNEKFGQRGKQKCAKDILQYFY